jgi:hypothetical protein
LARKARYLRPVDCSDGKAYSAKGRFMSSQNPNLRKMLAHILWIGGGTDAGKSTIANSLVERHGLQSYNFDRHERSHIERRIAAGDYQGRKNPYEWTPDEMWVDLSPEVMASQVIRSWLQRVDFVVEDLLAMPKEPLIIAEGPGFFPEVIEPLLSSYHQAIWFVPELAFKRKIHAQRGKPTVQHQIPPNEKPIPPEYPHTLGLDNHSGFPQGSCPN